jgi:hypothetical protein
VIAYARVTGNCLNVALILGLLLGTVNVMLDGRIGQAALIFALHSEFALLLNSREPFADLDMALFVWVNRGEASVDRDTISVWQVPFGSEGEPSSLLFQHYTKSKRVQ